MRSLPLVGLVIADESSVVNRLREAIAEKMQSLYGAVYDPETEVTVTPELIRLYRERLDRLCGGRAASAEADLPDVVLCFAEGRDATSVALHGHGAGVVRGQGQFLVAVVAIEQLTQVTGAAPDVVFGVVGVEDAEVLGRLRHELHEAPRPFSRRGPRVHVALRDAHRLQQLGGELPALGRIERPPAEWPPTAGFQPFERCIGLMKEAIPREPTALLAQARAAQLWPLIGFSQE